MSPGIYDGDAWLHGAAGFARGAARGIERGRRIRDARENQELAYSRDRRAEEDQAYQRAQYERSVTDWLTAQEQEQAAQRLGTFQAQHVGILPRTSAGVGPEGPVQAPPSDYLEQYFPRLSPGAQRAFIQDWQELRAVGAEQQQAQQLEQGRQALLEDLRESAGLGVWDDAPEEVEFLSQAIAQARSVGDILAIARHRQQALERVADERTEMALFEEQAVRAQEQLARMPAGEPRAKALRAYNQFLVRAIDPDELADHLIEAETGEHTVRGMMRQAYDVWTRIVDDLGPGDEFTEGAYTADGQMSPKAEAAFRLNLHMLGIPTPRELERRLLSYRYLGMGMVPEMTPRQRRLQEGARAIYGDILAPMGEPQYAPGQAGEAGGVEGGVPPAPTPETSSAAASPAVPVSWGRLPARRRSAVQEGILGAFKTGGFEAVGPYLEEQGLTFADVPRAVWLMLGRRRQGEDDAARAERDRDASVRQRMVSGSF